MILEVWDWKVENKIFDIPEDCVIDFSDTGDSLSGVDFWSSESRQIQVKYYAGEDQALNEYFFEYSSYIINSDYLKLCVVCEKNGETEYYFIDSNSLNKNYKTKTVDFKADNLLGLIIDFTDEDVGFGTTLYETQGVIETLINKLFQNIENNEYTYNLSIDYENAGLETTNYQIKYENNNLFSGTSPYIDEADQHEKSLNWQFIGSIGGNTTLVIIDLDWEDWQDYEQVWHNTIYIKYIKLTFDEDVNYTIEEFTNQEFHDTEPYSNTLWENYCGGFGFYYGAMGFSCDPNDFSPQIEYTNPDGFDYELTDGNLFFTGTIVNDKIKFKEEEGENEVTFSIKKGLRILLLYNNLYIRTHQNNIYVGAKFNSDIPSINIEAEEIIEQEQSMISQEELPDIFDIVSSNYVEVIKTFYEEFFSSIRKNFSVLILADNQELSILDKIDLDVYASDLIINKIKIDNDNQIYTVEDWR